MVDGRRRHGAAPIRTTGTTRLVSRRPARKASRVGSTLVGLGFVTVLAVAFFGGVVAGRHYPKLLPSLGGSTVAKEPRRGTDGRVADRAKSVEPAPVLTFYQELTAPLTSPPPATKKADRPKPDRIEREAVQKTGGTDAATRSPDRSPAGRADLVAPAPTIHSMGDTDGATASLDRPPAALPEQVPPAPTTPGSGEPRFTIQVGAFKLREQAEAIRARLAASGHDAFIVDFDSSAATRYRVRVGSYASRDEARLAAERLTATERLPTYVTSR